MVRGEFESALLVLATVVSGNVTVGLTVDAGWKAVSLDAGPPTVHGETGAEYRFAGDEHGKVTGVGGLGLGDQVALLPAHCDTTIHLHDRYVLVRDDGRHCGTLPLRFRAA